MTENDPTPPAAPAGEAHVLDLQAADPADTCGMNCVSLASKVSEE